MTEQSNAARPTVGRRMTDDLVAFLRDRLDEDERIARRPGDSFRQIGETGVIVATEGDRAEECASANWAGVADHIVRHDPARVLREVEGKRGVIALYDRAVVDSKSSDFLVRGPAPMVITVLTPVLAHLAQAYSAHSDYRPEWKPDV